MNQKKLEEKSSTFSAIRTLFRSNFFPDPDEYDPKNKNDLKQKDELKIKTTSKLKKTSTMKVTSKMET